MNQNISDMINKLTNTQTNNISENPDIMSIIGNFPPGKLLAIIIFSLLGTAYFIYGKRMAQFSFIFGGIVLMTFTYAFSNTLYMFLAGFCLSILPFYCRN